MKSNKYYVVSGLDWDTRTRIRSEVYIILNSNIYIVNETTINYFGTSKIIKNPSDEELLFIGLLGVSCSMLGEDSHRYIDALFRYKNTV